MTLPASTSSPSAVNASSCCCGSSVAKTSSAASSPATTIFSPATNRRCARNEVSIRKLSLELPRFLLQLLFFARQTCALLSEVNQTFERHSDFGTARQHCARGGFGSGAPVDRNVRGSRQTRNLIGAG